MPASEISLKEAKQDKLFYVVVNGLVYRKNDGRFLLLKRSMREKAHPGKWVTPGGKMEWGDFDITKPGRMNGDIIDFPGSLEDLLRREAREEAGIEVGDEFHFINSVTFVRPDGIPVVLIKFAVEYKEGEVVLEEGDFDDYAWANEKEAGELDCVGGTCEEIHHATSLLGLA